MAENDELKAFRATWRQELTKSVSSSKQAGIEKDEKDCITATATDQNIGEHAVAFNDAPFPFQFTDNLLRNWQNKPEPVCSKTKRELETVEVEKFSVSKKQRKSLVDIFIDDLNDLNDIPFFDISLPREIALQIFSHFSHADLCSCAQVSKAWQGLAEDKQLWRILYEKVSMPPIECGESVCWKSLFKEHFTKAKRLRSNWKEHKCQIKYYHHARGGVLTCAHSSGSNVVSGYTNGQIRVWNLDNHDSQTFQPCSKSLNLIEADAEHSLGTSSNYVSCVKAGREVVVAGYNHGHIQAWGLNSSHNPYVNEFTGRHINSLVLHEEEGIVYVHHRNNNNLSAQITLLNLHPEEDIYLAVIDSINIDENSISRVPPKELHETVPISTLGHSVLAYANGNNICVCTTTRNEHTGKLVCQMSSVEEFYGISFTCLKASEQQLCVGIVAHLGIRAEYKVRCYDTGTCAYKYDLCGHTSRVTCIDSGSSDPNVICTGCHDRRIRLFDTRLPAHSAIMLSGSSGTIQQVQVDDWKVASGDTEGLVCVWDQRMSTKLWEYQTRHPVQYLHFTKEFLISANVPTVLFPDEMDSDHMTHLRYRGNLQVSNFNVDQETIGIPEICSSSYDTQEGSTYNLSLITPYDTI